MARAQTKRAPVALAPRLAWLAVVLLPAAPASLSRTESQAHAGDGDGAAFFIRVALPLGVALRRQDTDVLAAQLRPLINTTLNGSCAVRPTVPPFPLLKGFGALVWGSARSWFGLACACACAVQCMHACVGVYRAIGAMVDTNAAECRCACTWRFRTDGGLAACDPARCIANARRHAHTLPTIRPAHRRQAPVCGGVQGSGQPQPGGGSLQGAAGRRCGACGLAAPPPRAPPCARHDAPFLHMCVCGWVGGWGGGAPCAWAKACPSVTHHGGCAQLCVLQARRHPHACACTAATASLFGGGEASLRGTGHSR